MKLNKLQKDSFVLEYLMNEMDVVFSTMTEDEQMETLKTTDPLEVFNNLLQSVSDINTTEEIEEGFGDSYDEWLDEIKYSAM